MASLNERLANWATDRRPKAPSTRASTIDVVAQPASVARQDEAGSEYGIAATRYRQFKPDLHRKLLDRLDLAASESQSEQALREQLATLLRAIIDEEGIPLNADERALLTGELQNEVMGLGPLEPLLADVGVSEIMVNGFENVYLERRGRIERVPSAFTDDAHLLRIIDKIVSRIGRRIDESSPMVDARLPDGSRVNAIIPPLALDGPVLTIRRFPAQPLTIDSLIEKGSLTASMAEFMVGLVRAKANIIISGGTGSGKTTLLNVMSGFIPSTERIITLEDTAELQLQQPHVVRLETRDPNLEGVGAVAMRALLKNSLRMRPDRIIVGEVRGEEVIDMLQAMNTGHSGSLATIHANTPRDALTRLENLVGLGSVNIPPSALRQQISSAIDVIVQTARLNDGSRRVTSIFEVTGMEGETITGQDIFYFDQTGIGPNGQVQGGFRATGIRPAITERLISYGIHFDEGLFRPDQLLD